MSSEFYTLPALMVGIPLPCRKVPLLPPALAREEVDFLVLKPVIACWVVTELRALLFGENVTEGYFCHCFSKILRVPTRVLRRRSFAFAYYRISPVVWW